MDPPKVLIPVPHYSLGDVATLDDDIEDFAEKFAVRQLTKGDFCFVRRSGADSKFTFAMIAARQYGPDAHITVIVNPFGSIKTIRQCSYAKYIRTVHQEPNTKLSQCLRSSVAQQRSSETLPSKTSVQSISRRSSLINGGQQSRRSSERLSRLNSSFQSCATQRRPRSAPNEIASDHSASFGSGINAPTHQRHQSCSTADSSTKTCDPDGTNKRVSWNNDSVGSDDFDSNIGNNHTESSSELTGSKSDDDGSLSDMIRALASSSAQPRSASGTRESLSSSYRVEEDLNNSFSSLYHPRHTPLRRRTRPFNPRRPVPVHQRQGSSSPQSTMPEVSLVAKRIPQLPFDSRGLEFDQESLIRAFSNISSRRQG